MSVWLPKSELPEKFRRRLKEVFISNTFFAPVNGGMGSDWYAGGETGMEPTELQTGVLEQAVKIAKTIPGVEEVRVERETLHLVTDSERAPEIAHELVAAGIGLEEIGPVQRSLEEAFFELTGEEV